MLHRKRQLLGDLAVALAERPVLELPLPNLGLAASSAVRALSSRIDAKLFEQRLVRPFGRPVDGADERGAGSSASPEIQPGAANAVVGELFDVQTMRDPRLRAMVQLDLACLDRALRQEEHRVALLMIAGVLEAVVLDTALPRREELGLPVSPEAWDLWALLKRLLGPELREIDKPMLSLLSRKQELFRPASQLVAPTVVVPGLVDHAVGFALRCLCELGFAAASGPAGQPSSAAQRTPV